MKRGETTEKVILTLGLDLNRLLLQQAHKLIFDPQTIQVEQEATAHFEKAGVAAATPLRSNTSLFPELFPRFGEVKTPSGRFGYIRLKSFLPDEVKLRDPQIIAKAVAEFDRILTDFPPKRSNTRSPRKWWRINQHRREHFADADP